MKQNNKNKNSERILSIDVLRGWSLIFMVMLHFIIFYGDAAAVDTWIYFIFNHVLGDWGAATFLMMMGMSQVLSADKYVEKNHGSVFGRVVIRGIFIFIVGLVLLTLAWGPQKLWDWDILTLMGFATIMLFFCRFLPSWLIVIFIVSLAICTPCLRDGIDFNASYGGGYINVPVISRYFPGILLDPAAEYEVVWRLKKIIFGFFFTGEFPVIPWFIFPLLGFVIGRRIVHQKMIHDLPFLAMIGSLLLLLSLSWAYAAMGRPQASIITGYMVPLSFYPDSFTMICFQSGVCLTLFSILFFCYDVYKKDKNQLSFLVRMYKLASESSLTFYFLHYLCIGWPLALLYLVSGKYCKYDLLGALAALFCGFGAVLFLLFVLTLWKKHQYKYSLEWILRAIIKRFAV